VRMMAARDSASASLRRCADHPLLQSTASVIRFIDFNDA